MKKQYWLVVLFSFVFLTGCMSNLSGQSYSRDEARQVQRVKLGTVLDVQMVQIEGTKSGVGAMAGAAAGGLAGSSVGNNKGSSIAAIAGAVAGGLIGGKGEEAYTRTQGIQLTIELEDGTYISVVQEYDENVDFHSGDSVKLLTSNGVTRVIQ